MTGEDLNRIDVEGLTVNAVDLDDREVVVVNREDPVGVAGDGNKTETVTGSNVSVLECHSKLGNENTPFASFDIDHSKSSVGRAIGVAAQTINQSSIRDAVRNSAN